MANTIQVRRGTAAELVGVALTQAELGYATDTDQVWIGDGAANHEFAMKNTIAAMKGIAYTAFSELTIATGVITVTQMYHTVDIETEIDATDDLVTINGGATVNLIVLRAEDGARTVVVKHNTGNIWLQGKADISLDDLEDGIMLAWDGTKWFDIAAGGGGGGGLADVVDDANPQLGGDLDVNSHNITQGATSIMEFSADGIVTIPEQSAAFAYPAEGTNQVILNGVDVRVLLDTEAYDIHNEFDTTVKTGTARDTTPNHLIDTTDKPFTATDVGRAVWNTTDDTYAVITVYNSVSDVTIDTDIMADTEGYKVYASRYTATVAGVYLVTALGAIAAVADGKGAGMKMRKNGLTVAANLILLGNTGYFYGPAVATLVLAIGDYVELFARQNDTTVRILGDFSNEGNLIVSKIS